MRKCSILISTFIILVTTTICYADDNNYHTCQYNHNYTWQSNCESDSIPKNVIIHNSNISSELIIGKIQSAFTNAISKITNAIYFDTDVYALTQEHENYILDILMQTKPKKITLVGYADSTGSSTYNLTLSLKRAASTEHYIKTIQPAIDIVTIGKGELDEFPKSRRVEIIIDK